MLRRYMGENNQACAREVATIVGPLLHLEDSAKEQAKAKKKRPVKTAAVEVQDNVVRAAFVG